MSIHSYNTLLKWTGNTGKGTKSYTSYQRSYQLSSGDKPLIDGSADPSFRGDLKKYNPEELFLASLSACHMLWYLHLCSVNKITVIKYTDKAEGIMVEESDGRGKFTSVILKPTVVIAEQNYLELAKKLHGQANKMCFIANSCNFIIEHKPIIQVV